MAKKILTTLLLSLILINPVGASTLYDHYSGDMPSFKGRAELFLNISEDKYIGSAEQNNLLVEYLEEGELLGGPTTNNGTKALGYFYGDEGWEGGGLLGANAPTTNNGEKVLMYGWNDATKKWQGMADMSEISPEDINLSEGAMIYGDARDKGTELASSSESSILQMNSSMKPEWTKTLGTPANPLDEINVDTLRAVQVEVSGLAPGGIFLGTTTNTFDTSAVFTNDYGSGSLDYKQADGSFRFSTDATTDAVTIADGGKFGVGTTTPAFDIHAYDNNGSVEIVAENDNTLGSSQLAARNEIGMQLTIGKLGSTLNIPAYGIGSGAIINRDGDLNVLSDGNDPIKFLTDETDALDFMATEKMRISANGNVGIGTTSPAYTLDVLPGANDGFLLGGDVTAKSRTDATRKFSRLFAPHYTNAEEPVSIIVTDSDGVNNLVSIGGGTASGNAATDVRIITAADNTTTAGSEVARWNEMGNMGLGLTGPVSRFHLYEDNAEEGNSTGITIEQDGLGDSILQYLITGVTRWTTGVDNSDDDKYKIGRGDAWTTGEDLVIDGSGNVGIGESAPLSKLHIDGGTGSLATGLAFGDGDSGISELSDDILFITTGGGSKWLAFSRFEGTQTGGAMLKSGASTLDQVAVGFKADNNTGLHWVSADKMSLVTAGVSAMTVDETQMIGLGTVNPSEKLTINDGSILLDNDAGTEYIGFMAFDALKYNFAVESSIDANKLLIRNGTTNVGAFDNDGELGIGTTNPTEKLHVVGRVIEDGTYGGIHAHDGSTAQTIPTGATYTKLTSFMDNNLESNVSSDAANDKITITETGVYQVSASLNFTDDTNNTEWKCSPFLGGVEQDSIHIVRKIGTAGDVGSASMTGTIDVTSASTDLDMRCRHDAGGNVDITVEYSNLNIQYLGET